LWEYSWRGAVNGEIAKNYHGAVFSLELIDLLLSFIAGVLWGLNKSDRKALLR
jgi:hypothetical protein